MSDDTTPPPPASAPTPDDRRTTLSQLYAHPDTLVVLRCTNTNDLLAKEWKTRPDGSQVKSDPRMPGVFVAAPYRIEPAGVPALSQLLTAMSAEPRAAVIRGGLLPRHVLKPQVYRLMSAKEGDPNADPTSLKARARDCYFEPAPSGRSWICLDIDNLLCPDFIDVRARPLDALRYVRSQLPEVFRDATCHFQWSGSMGLGEKAWKYLKVHLWFWLKDAVLDADLATWAKSLGKTSIIDRALFSAIQLHYTARPRLFGIPDPFTGENELVREGVLAGHKDVVDLLPIVSEVVFGTKAVRARPAHSTRPPNGASRANEPPAMAISRTAPISNRTNAFLAQGAADGARNQSLFDAASDMHGCHIPINDAEPQLLAAAAQCSPPMDIDEARTTIESAFSAPREPSRPPKTPALLLYELCPEPNAVPGTEYWFARAFCEAHRKGLRFVAAFGTWRHWDCVECRWRDDDSKLVLFLATDFAVTKLATVFGQIIAVLAEEAKARKETSESETAKTEETADNEPDYEAIIARYQSKTPLFNALELVKAERGIASTPDTWDQDPFLLCVANGTLDLRTGDLRESKRDDYITKCSPVAFDANAEAPKFQAFLERILPDPEVRKYVQRSFGYAVLGLIREHALHVFHGTGANGKSTLIEVISHVLGDYAATAPSSLLLESKSDRHPTEQAFLCGKRLIFSSETPAGGKLNENLVKSLTGGDTITARRMHENFWSFKPTHKWFLATNHRPRISGNDEAIWRRVRLIPFDVTIPPDERDPLLGEKLRAEAPGILRWIIEGTREYLKHGLNPPAAVLAATQEYRTAEDIFGQFVDERLVRESGFFLSTQEIIEAHQAWCLENGMPRAQLTGKALAEHAKRLTWTAHSSGKRRGYLGRRLRSDGDKPVDRADPMPGNDSMLTALTHTDGRIINPSAHQDSAPQGLASPVDTLTADSEKFAYARAHTHVRAHESGNLELASKCQLPSAGEVDGTADAFAGDDFAPSDATGGDDGDDTRHGGGARVGDGARAAARPLEPPPCSCSRRRDVRRLSPSQPWVCNRCHPPGDPDGGPWEFFRDEAHDTERDPAGPNARPDERDAERDDHVDDDGNAT